MDTRLKDTSSFNILSLFYPLTIKTTGLWNEVERTKIVMSEARGGQKKEFDEQLKDFYDTIRDFEDKGIKGLCKQFEILYTLTLQHCKYNIQ